MHIDVNYINSSGNITDKKYKISKLAFIKHMAIAGQKYAPQPSKFLRSVGMFFHYFYYMQTPEFNNDYFSLPPIELSDPTEKGQFSNLAGKAIADFLSKKIDGSIYTVNYEAAMRIQGIPIIGERPDLLAFSPGSIFAIEAKGYTNSPGNMNKHKRQSKTGAIPVNFSVACSSYHLYKRIKCKYYDPIISDATYDELLLKKLTMSYYQKLSEFLENDFFEFNEIDINGEQFYAVKLSYDRTDHIIFCHLKHHSHFFYEILKNHNPEFLLPRNILEYAKQGITKDLKPFVFESDNIYIDNDRVGFKINV